MKRLAAVMMMAMLVSACGDSSTGVNTASRRSGGGDFIPPDSVPKGHAPDSVYTIGNVVIREYGENNPRVWMLDESLPRVDAVKAVVNRYGASGYGEPVVVAAAQATLPDGRGVDLALVEMDGLSGELVQMLVAYLEGTCAVTPMRVVDGRVVDIEQACGDPELQFTMNLLGMARCLAQAAAEYKACLDDCGCQRACLAYATYVFAFCYLITSL
jgi:hypothetical protein